MSPLFRGAKFRECRFSGFKAGIYIPLYIPSEKKGYKVIFYDSLDNKIGELGSDIRGPAINRIDFEMLDSGCGSFKIIMDGEIPFEIDYRTRVDIFPYFSSDPWYTGFIQTTPKKSQIRAPYEYSGFGYYEQLDWILINGTYENADLSDIIKDIVENDVAAKTHIKYNAEKIADPEYTVTKIEFDHVYAKDALQTLAELVSGYEFGVDNFREFYFRAKDTTSLMRLWATKHFSNFSIDEDSTKVKNRLFVKQGQIVDGSNIAGSVEDATSISIYGAHEDVITAPEILNSSDALQWAAQVLASKKLPKVSGSVENVFLDEIRTVLEPKGKVKITDEKGETFEVPIKSVSYSISSQGIFAKLDLGS